MNDLQREIEHRFAWNPPATGQEAQQHISVRSMLRNTASFLVDVVPDSRELRMAIDAIDAARMWASAALARHSNPASLDPVAPVTAEAEPVNLRERLPMDPPAASDGSSGQPGMSSAPAPASATGAAEPALD